MKQPLMLIPPAQAEVLSDNFRIDFAKGNLLIEDRFASSRWLDDDLPDEPALVPGDALRPAARPRRCAA